ncbi:MAG: LysM peptidoglycan-binding domain-containing M23 family metallopeptidase [Alphaproteobacteria bacterium]
MDTPSVRSSLAVLVVAVAGLTAAGCERSGGPAPVVYGNVSGTARPAAPQPDSGTITVQRGDSVHAIARRHRVPVKALIVANGLAPPFTLRAGQSLVLPSIRLHVVQKGDTINGIARRYQVESPALVRINDLKPPYIIQLGTTLAIPEVGTGEASPVKPSAPMVAAAPAGGDRPPPSPYSAAGKVVSEPLDSPPSPPPAPQVAAQQDPVQVAPEPAPALSPAPASTPAPAASPPRVATSPDIPTPPARSGRAFQWPVAGKVVAKYGSMGDGLQNDGVNIAVPRGTPVRAADNGVVVYAGNELKGFGNLLLIKHADGWMTAYAHHETITVNRGDKVTRGQVVGTVGSSGSAPFPQLHFEVRRGVKAVDPTPLMENLKV